MARILKQQNVYFEPLQVLFDVINSHVPDPYQERATRPTAREKRWIFPNTPEANDENYPRIALLHGNLTFEEWTAGQFLESQKNVGGGISEVNTNLAVLPIVVGVFAKKTSHRGLDVTDYDGTERYVENSMLVTHLLDKIQKEIHAHRTDFIDKDMEISILNMDGPYEDNDFLWAGNINMEVRMKNIWTEDISVEKVIASLSYTFNIELTTC